MNKIKEHNDISKEIGQLNQKNPFFAVCSCEYTKLMEQ